MSDIHAIMRARQRYGLELKPADLNTLVSAIEYRDGAVYIGKRKKTTEVWKVRFRDHWIYVAYKPAHNCIVSVLTKEQAEAAGQWAPKNLGEYTAR